MEDIISTWNNALVSGTGNKYHFKILIEFSFKNYWQLWKHFSYFTYKINNYQPNGTKLCVYICMIDWLYNLVFY